MFKILLESMFNYYIEHIGILILTIFCFIFCILIKIFYPKIRGYMGEFWVKRELNKLPKEEYTVLNNLIIKIDGKTSQIDHLVISKFGIFVIEMKNYYGFIYGDKYKQKWSQSFGKKKFYFYNPIHQNYGHIKALESILELPSEMFIPIICFSNQATLKVNTKTRVVQTDNLVLAILDYKEEILHQNLEDILRKITNENLSSSVIRKEHVTKIKEEILRKEELERKMVCPKCGGQLIKRKGKYGGFVGCSNFPRCKYTNNN